MTQSVIQIGNSLGVTLPSDFVKKHHLKKGSKITIVASNSQISFSTRAPKTTTYSPITDTELAEAVKEVESRYGKALDELARLQ